jgi:hypothetical protein
MCVRKVVGLFKSLVMLLLRSDSKNRQTYIVQIAYYWAVIPMHDTYYHNDLTAASELLESRLTQHGQRRDDLADLLQTRESQAEETLYRLDEEIMRCNGYLMTLNEVIKPFSNQTVEKKRQGLALIRMNLEGQRRQEIQKAWTDRARTRQELTEAQINFENAQHRRRLLG